MRSPSPGDTSRIVFVLVRPLYPGNVGGCARALANFGFPHLRIVGSRELLDEECMRMARNGGLRLLEGATFHETVADALRGVVTAFGTSAREGKDRSGRILELHEAARLAAAGTGRGEGSPANEGTVAFLFGREDRGLLNEELSLCRYIVRIPTARAMPSMNLSHAVAVTAYELASTLRGSRREAAVHPAAEEPPHAPPEEEPAPLERIDEAVEHARDLLMRCGFLNPQNPDHILNTLKRRLAAMGTDMHTLSILRGMVRQLEWYVNRLEKACSSASGPRGEEE